MFKSGYVAIVGSPNSGKSTLLNSLLDSKLAITSDKVNTTRNMIRGIYTDEERQIIFVDTPGINKPQNKLQVYMRNQINEALKSVDVILYVLDAKVGVRKRELAIIDRISQFEGTPKIACVNKLDLIDQPKAMEIIEQLQETEVFDDIIATSLKEGFNNEGIIKTISEFLPEGAPIYDEDEVTDMTEKFYVSEIIREKVLRNTFDEIPHGIYVRVDEIIHEEGRVIIEAVIFVEENSHKGMVIGSKGSMIKTVGQNARYDLERYYDKKVFLDLVVRVDKGWTNKREDFEEINQ